MTRKGNIGGMEDSKEGIIVSHRAWFTLAILSWHPSDSFFLRDHASTCNPGDHKGV